MGPQRRLSSAETILISRCELSCPSCSPPEGKRKDSVCWSWVPPCSLVHSASGSNDSVERPGGSAPPLVGTPRVRQVPWFLWGRWHSIHKNLNKDRRIRIGWMCCIDKKELLDLASPSLCFPWPAIPKIFRGTILLLEITCRGSMDAS
jgi:hypothetical protein